MKDENIIIRGDANTVSLFKRVWWLVLIRGILALILGIISLVSPLITGIAITLVFGIYALSDGIIGLFHAWRSSRQQRPYGWVLFGAIVSVLAGLAVLIMPGIVAEFGALYFTVTIAFYAMLFGFASMFTNSELSGKEKFWAIVSGLLTVAAGIILMIFVFIYPAEVLLTTIIWVIGIYAIILGISLIIMAFRIRKKIVLETATPAASPVAEQKPTE
ncbi:MAG: DUF308 domain-containing protein [Microbacteriaceae bacterium]